MVWQSAYYFYPALISLLLSFISIFIYKKIKTQRKIVAIARLISTILLIYSLFDMFTGTDNSMSYAIPCYLFFATLFDSLAIRGMVHDEKLLADSTRLR